MDGKKTETHIRWSHGGRLVWVNLSYHSFLLVVSRVSASSVATSDVSLLRQLDRSFCFFAVVLRWFSLSFSSYNGVPNVGHASAPPLIPMSIVRVIRPSRDRESLNNSALPVEWSSQGRSIHMPQVVPSIARRAQRKAVRVTPGSW